MFQGERYTPTRKSESEIGIPDLSAKLAEQPLSTVTPILMEFAKRRVEKLKADQVLSEYNSKSEFYRPSSIDQRELTKFNERFFSVLPQDFKALELSPITPLGLNSTITKLSQDLLLSTTRGSEIVGDSTTPLALEAAYRRRQNLLSQDDKASPVKLATSTRVLRMQPFDKDKGYMQHFSLLGLCSAGKDAAGSLFSEQAAPEHISIWLDLVNKLSEQDSSRFNNISVRISDVNFLEKIIEQYDLPRAEVTRNSLNEDWNMFTELNVPLPNEIETVEEITEPGLQASLRNLQRFEQSALPALKERYPGTTFTFDLNRKAGLGYYDGLCFHVYATNKSGREVQLADGGAVDWTSKFLNSSKERSFTSGFGSELVQKLFT